MKNLINRFLSLFGYIKPKPVIIRKGMMITKASEVKAIIEPIPNEEFITGKFMNSRGQSCFLGHINRTISLSGDANEDFNGFGTRELTAKFLREIHGSNYLDGTHVNNWNDINGYNEDNPKDRVMHLVNDMIKAGY